MRERARIPHSRPRADERTSRRADEQTSERADERTSRRADEQTSMASIGRSIPRKEGPAKVTGRARYVDDLALPGMLHGVTVRSPVPRGTIRNIRFDPAIPWDEFTIVTAADIPGANVVALITDDQPYLASGRVNHAEEPVLLLGHADRHLVELARRAVTIEIDPLPPVMTIEESLARQEIVWGSDNIFKSYLVAKGDVDAVWSQADVIV